MKSSGERTIFWLIVILLIAGAIYGVIRLVTPPVDVPLPNEISEDDWIKGNSDSSVILIEYSDFQCPACVYYNTLVQEVMDEFGNHIQFAYRHYPLKSLHPNATLAAQAAEAAGIQGKFWEMHDILFEKQSEWDSLKGDELENAFIGYAHELNLDQKQFIKNLNSKTVKNLVEAEYQSARQGGLTGTPSFFLNGEQVRPGELENFRTLIRQAIEENNS